MHKLLIICGPTATGKTKLALSIAKRHNGELVSVDSRQVYKGMDVGTGKDYPADGSRIWLYDVVSPDEEFSVEHYQRLAHAAIEDIRKRGKLPVIVGGTGLYIKSLIEPMETISVPPDEKLRKELYVLPIEDLQERLREVAPNVWDTMNTSDRQNPRRIIRKIEITRYGLSKLSFKEPRSSSLLQQDVLSIGLTARYSFLYERIDRRVEDRVRQGIVNEIKGLLDKGFSWDLPSMNTMGYIQWKEYFTSGSSEAAYDTAIRKWKFDEHAYARRQMTWFRKQKDIHWLDITSSDVEALAQRLVDVWYNASI